jgi:hypothetical protein
MVAPDLSHLLPATQSVALQPDQARIAHIRADRWIGYTRARQALVRLDSLLTHPKRQRMPNLLIVGPTNNGKSMIVEKFRRLHPPVPRGTSEPDRVPVLTVQMPSGPDIKRFYTLILHALGMPTYPHQNVAQKEDHTLYMLESVDVRLLVIDEVHNILAGPVARQREFLNLLRFLGNTLKIALVCVGTKDAYLAIRNDAQLENRFEPFALPLWKDNDEYASLLASFEAVLPLRQPSNLAEPALASHLLAKTEGTIGELTTLITLAATQAIITGQEFIDRTLINSLVYHGPNERRRLFERTLT